MAALLENYLIFLFPLFIILVLSLFRFTNPKKPSSLPTNWPLVGMLPGLLHNIHRVHDYMSEILISNGGTFEFKGPLFCNMDSLYTCHPANINHIFTKRFSNYPKGPEFNKIFDILGDSIFNADFKLWDLHRRATLSLLNHANFYTDLERSTWETVRSGLFPVFDHFSQHGLEMDMQDILERFAFDNICQILVNYNPRSLSIDLPHVPCEKALSDALEPLLHRHILPEGIWRLQNWLNIGNEKKLNECWKAFDDFIYTRLSLGPDAELCKIFGKAYEESSIAMSRDLREFLRDTFLGLLVAGRDSMSTTLTWLFWLLSKNPSAEKKILEEVETVLLHGKEWRFFDVEESRKLVYLHAAIYETLRLFPPVSFEQKSAVEADSLPSGNNVCRNGKVVVSFYSTGRMESVWGKDCLEFKPERWMSSSGGGLKHEPSYKFPAFNVGPRTCPGKEISMVEMKMVAAAIMHRYHIEVVEGHPVSPSDSVILKAKHGLNVRLYRKGPGLDGSALRP